ncbi:hypothetical protein HanIR_Chr11g0538221 [Helianthus annuus]|nr:hypothetical protein HanIR_Chr11g0538221 [Helianthus annuus]
MPRVNSRHVSIHYWTQNFEVLHCHGADASVQGKCCCRPLQGRSIFGEPWLSQEFQQLPLL